jgi:hypothetical protein
MTIYGVMGNTMSSPDKDNFLEILPWRNSIATPIYVYREPADKWVGLYSTETHRYLCLLPTIVIKWSRRM